MTAGRTGDEFQIGTAFFAQTNHGECPFRTADGFLQNHTALIQHHTQMHPMLLQTFAFQIINNIMADHRNFRHVMEFCHDHRLKVDVFQGLDCRLMTPENAELLADVKPMANFVFAFDSLSYKRQVIECIEMLRDAGMDLHSNVMFYVYCDRTIDGEYGFKSALERCKILKENNTNPYVMLNIDAPPTQDMKNLKRWANRKHIFWSCQFEDYTRKVRA